MARAPTQIDDSETSSKTEWYQVEESEQIAFYRNEETGDNFYISDAHEGRLRPSGDQYVAVYRDRIEGTKDSITFDSLADIESLEKLDDFTVEDVAKKHLN